MFLCLKTQSVGRTSLFFFYSSSPEVCFFHKGADFVALLKGSCEFSLDGEVSLFNMLIMSAGWTNSSLQSNAIWIEKKKAFPLS